MVWQRKSEIKPVEFDIEIAVAVLSVVAILSWGFLSYRIRRLAREIAACQAEMRAKFYQLGDDAQECRSQLTSLIGKNSRSFVDFADLQIQKNESFENALVAFGEALIKLRKGVEE